jgi:O-antigen ligase
MSSLQALLVCIVFVLLLLWLERRQSRGVSPSLWIPTLWMLIIASRPLATWFVAPGGVTLGNDSGSALDRWVLTVLAVAAIVVLVNRRIHWWDCLRRHKWLLALLAYMLLSTFWSQITAIALKRWIRELIVLLMALVMQSEVNPRQALESVLRRTAYVLLPFSIVLIKYYPALGRAYGKYSGIEMWTGVTGQKNELGRLCMISSFFLFFALYRRWRDTASRRENRSQVWADGFILLVALYLLVGSASSTSLATLILGICTFIGLRLFRWWKLGVPQAALLVLVIVLMVFGVATPFLGGSTVAGLTSTLGRNTTLTGRTEIWADVIPAWEKQPVLGYGFGSFWTDARRKLYRIPSSHNGYLDILLELGEVGLAIYFVWLLSCARKLHRAFARDYDWASIALCFLLMGLIYNISESALNTLTEHMTAVTVFAIFIVSIKTIPIAKYPPARPNQR